MWTNVRNKHRRHFPWFEKWIIEGFTFKQLAKQSGHSVSTIRRIVDYWLSQEPPLGDSAFKGCANAIADGTFIDKRRGLFAVMDAVQHTLVHGAYNISEGPRDLRMFFHLLAQKGLSLKYATVDGNPSLSLALQLQWPKIVLQRCLVHIQRQGLQWCRRYPKRPDAKALRPLFIKVTNINTAEERDLFLQQLSAWEQKYGASVASAPERGKVFSDIKRARSMLLTALPKMFHYLENPAIAKSTNALEGYYARLKQRYRQHRGLSPRKRDAYFRWYMTLCKR